MDQRIRLICGDAIEEMRKLPDESVRLIATDPPYNLNKNYGNNQDSLQFEEYLTFTRQWLLEAKRVLTGDGSLYVFMGMRYISYVYTILEQELGMTFNSWITWFYTQGTGKTRGFSPRHDDILLAEPFSGFDSIDERMKRVPNDLNDPVLRREYMQNHIAWFLRNHPDAVAEFMEEAREKYGPDFAEAGQLNLFGAVSGWAVNQ